MSRERTFAGLIGNGCRSTTAVTIEHTHCINGSGGDAFGGASEWPMLRVQIEVQVGEEGILRDIEGDIVKLLERNELLGRRHTKRWQQVIRQQAGVKRERKSSRRTS